MKAFAALLLLLGTAICQADTLRVGQDDLIFNTRTDHTPKIIEWIIVEDLEQACNGKPKNPGQGELRGCAKFNKTKCFVYTKKQTTLANLGHEMRHCFEGQWHEPE
jgi:hypothetical protein